LSNVIVAQLETSHVDAELWLNGTPLVRGTGEWTRTSRPVHQHLRRGLNKLELVVEPGPIPTRARLPWGTKTLDRGAWAEARLLSFEDGSAPEPELGVSIGKLRFEERLATDLGRDHERRFPEILSIDVRPAWGTDPIWESATPLQLDESLLEEARAVLDQLAASLRGGDREAYERAAGLRIRGFLRAYPAMTSSMAEADIKQIMVAAWERPDFIQERDPSMQDFRLVCGDRLLQAIDRDFKHSFKYQDADGEGYGDELFLARMDGKLRIVV
jgi:hypothetical protein